MSPLWACRKVKSLFDEDEMRVVSAQSSQVLTNVGCWDVETNISTLVANFLKVQPPSRSHHHGGWGNGGWFAEITESYP